MLAFCVASEMDFDLSTMQMVATEGTELESFIPADGKNAESVCPEEMMPGLQLVQVAFRVRLPASAAFPHEPIP